MFKKWFTKLKRSPYWPEFLSVPDRPLSPRQHFGSIFDVIQISHTFKDSKTFVDTIPKKAPSKIKKQYHKSYSAQLDLSRFVRDNFVMPDPIKEPEPINRDDNTAIQVRAYIDAMWNVLTREADQAKPYSSLLALPHRYIVPGGRFREIYYWDSYFTMFGLRESNRADLMEAMVKNFAHIIETYGFIPNGNRTYYLTRSQPPVFAHMVELLAEVKGEQELDTYARLIYREYAYWMRGAKAPLFANGTINASEHVVRMPDDTILNRYWDESISPREESFREDLEIGRTMDESATYYRNMRAGAESGWDFSSRWFAEGGDLSTIRTIDIVPIDLNVFLLHTEEILARIYQRQKRFTLSEKYNDLAQQRREALQDFFWHEEDGWYYDYDLAEQTLSTQCTIAGAFALYGGIASPEQAPRMVEMIEHTFLRPGGVVVSMKNTGEQWDAPNGWAPLQYITVMGLERYGASELAEEVARRWCSLNLSLYEKTGLLFEKYNVEDIDTLASGGEYTLQHGFGWTNGVLITLMNKYHINTSDEDDEEDEQEEESSADASDQSLHEEHNAEEEDEEFEPAHTAK